MALRPVLTCLGLCAGIGGLELGIRLGEHLRGHDVRGVCYVEREAAGAASLVASMDAGWLHPAPVWSDLATFDGRPWRGRVHILASGDPCQGNSVAGLGLGADDPRFLIPQVLRIVDEVRPDRLVRENVTGNAAGQLDALVGALESMGYLVAAGIFSSGRTGNSHGRERLVVVADRKGGAGWLHAGPRRPDEAAPDAGGDGTELADCEGRGLGELWAAAWQGCLRHADGGGAGLGGSVADASGARCGARAVQQPRGEGWEALALERGGELVVADCTDVARRRQRSDASGREEQARHARLAVGGMDHPAVIPGPSDPAWRDILDRWPQLAPALSEAEAQSLLRGGIDAVAHRIERLRACGNGVDPVVGAYAVLRLGALLADERAKRAAGHAILTSAA